MIIKLAALGALGYAGYRYYQKNQSSQDLRLAGGPLSSSASLQSSPDQPPAARPAGS